MEFGPILIMLAVLIVLARVGYRIFARFGVPGLIGEIIIGIVIANLAIGDWSFLSMFDIDMGTDPSRNYEIITLFAEFGVMFLLFTIGMETKARELLSVGRAAMTVATMGVVIPFTAGFLLIQVYDGNIHHALFLGAALVATSVGITARVIKDMKLIGTKEAKIIIGAAVIDDVQGMVVLAIVVGMAASGEMAASNIAAISIEAVLFVAAALVAALWIVPRAYGHFEERNRKAAAKAGKRRIGTDKLILAVVVCLLFSWFADAIGLAAIIGAFLGGMLLADYAREWKLGDKIEPITAFFISFFFLNVGMQVDLRSMADVSVIILAAAVTVAAVATKYVGCSIGARLGDKGLSKESRNIIGVGMVPRGEVGIIVASIGLYAGAMSSEIYGTVILMAVVTTIIAPPMLARAFRKKYPEYMQDTEGPA